MDTSAHDLLRQAKQLDGLIRPEAEVFPSLRICVGAFITVGNAASLLGEGSLRPLLVETHVAENLTMLMLQIESSIQDGPSRGEVVQAIIQAERREDRIFDDILRALGDIRRAINKYVGAVDPNVLFLFTKATLEDCAKALELQTNAFENLISDVPSDCSSTNDLGPNRKHNEALNPRESHHPHCSKRGEDSALSPFGQDPSGSVKAQQPSFGGRTSTSAAPLPRESLPLHSPPAGTDTRGPPSTTPFGYHARVGGSSGICHSPSGRRSCDTPPVSDTGGWGHSIGAVHSLIPGGMVIVGSGNVVGHRIENFGNTYLTKTYNHKYVSKHRVSKVRG